MSGLPSNHELAAAFTELADRLELVESSPYRWLAYRKAAAALGELGESAAQMAQSGELLEVPGMGPATVEKVRSYAQTGTFPALDRAREQVPDGLLELTRVQGIGAKTARLIWDTTQATSFGEAQAAATSDQIRIPGVGPATLAALAAHTPKEAHVADPRVRRDTAQSAFSSLAQLITAPQGELIEAGDLTRGEELIREVVAVVSGTHTTPSHLADALADRGWSSITATAAGVTGVAASGAAVRVVVCEPEEVDRIASDELGPAARAMIADTELVRVEDIRADLHTHTDWSDGVGSVEAMATAARDLGLRVYAITDHSAPYAMVNGLGPDRIALQRQEIARVQSLLAGDVDLLCGSEVEVLADGSLGLDDETLASLDWVVASIHTQQRMDAASLRARYERVLSNPLVDCIGHPTGRLLLKRDPMNIEMTWLIEQAAAAGVMLELNANPRRLDLSTEHVRMAIEAGVPICINTDAHNAESLGLRSHGIAVARRAGARPTSVVNTWELSAIQDARPRNRA